MSSKFEEFTESEAFIRPGMGTPCLVWKRGRGDAGYGFCLGEDGKQKKAHRFAWEKSFGPIPDGKMVLHRCDNRPCVNVDHLFIGTQLDNMRDMYSKGRNGYTGHVGEQHPNVKFTTSDVLKIRSLFASGVNRTQIRKQFGGSKSAIDHIVTRYNWKHL